MAQGSLLVDASPPPTPPDADQPTRAPAPPTKPRLAAAAGLVAALVAVLLNRPEDGGPSAAPKTPEPSRTSLPSMPALPSPSPYLDNDRPLPMSPGAETYTCDGDRLTFNISYASRVYVKQKT